jgi:hypothetical protein
MYPHEVLFGIQTIKPASLLPGEKVMPDVSPRSCCGTDGRRAGRAQGNGPWTAHGELKGRK